MLLEQGHGYLQLQGEAGRRDPHHRDIWDATAPVVLQDSLLLFILSNWNPVAADPAATVHTLWAIVLPDGQGQMTWPPALMESTGGHAEGADTRTRGLRRLKGYERKTRRAR